MSERIGDRDIQPAVTAAEGMITPDQTRWTVVLDSRGQPATAISPAGRYWTDSLVVADAELTVASLFQSGALAGATLATQIVVTREGVVAGVWSVDDFVDALMHGGTRESSMAMAGDAMLPGVITKKNITRRCRRAEQGHTCVTVLVVPEKPEVMPRCPARDGIDAHSFEW